MNKQEYRDLIKERLDSLSSESRHFKSLEVSRNIASVLNNLKNLTIVGGFSPIQKEPLWYLSSWFEQVRLAVPSVEENFEMSFYETELGKLSLQKLGLNLSGDEKLREVVPEVFIVPGLGFTKAGVRLGRGKGYYDRYLSRIEGVKLGICFEEQIEEELPSDKFDVKMDYVITDLNIYRGI